MEMMCSVLAQRRFLSSILVSVIFSASQIHSRIHSGEGIPGIDYPEYSKVPPRLQFSCKDRVGYFADPETNCQVWHWCLEGGLKYSFLCPNSTVFNQQYRVCDWWYNVDCTLSPNLYNVNEDLYRDYDGNRL